MKKTCLSALFILVLMGLLFIAWGGDTSNYHNDTEAQETDTDGEGLSDDDEVQGHKTSPVLEDTNGDGLDDLDDPNPVEKNYFGIAEGFNRNVIIKTDGTLWAWGRLSQSGGFGFGYGIGTEETTPTCNIPGKECPKTRMIRLMSDDTMNVQC